MKVTKYLPILAVCLMTTGCNSKKEAVLTSGIDLANLDTTAMPGTSFYQYACGGWVKDHPLTDEYSRFGTFDMLRENSREQLKALIAELAAKKDNAPGSAAQKVGDLYNIAMDSVKLNQEGVAPIKAELAAIDALKDKGEIYAYIAESQKKGIRPYFTMFVSADDMNSSMNIVQTYQGGIGMGQRDYYLENDEQTKNIRNKYQEHIAKMFQLAGYDEATAQKAVKAVMNIETRLAKAARSQVELRDPHANYNKMDRATLKKNFPTFDWDTYFTVSGLKDLEEVNVGQPAAMKEVADVINTVSLDDQKLYLQWGLIDAAASYLSDDFEAQNFDFYSRTMSGKKEMSFKALVYSNPVIFSLIIIGFILLVVTIVFMYFWFKMKNQVIYFKMKKVENISKVRSEFLSRMSHEIRTPLNAIIGLANLMRLSGEGDPVTQKNISKIDSSAKFLLSIVNDILDMSKIESGKIQIESRPFSMDNLLRQLSNIFLVMAEERKIKLQFKCCFTHKNFVGDELRLKQVLINLLSNAHKFTENNGEITVTVLESAAEEGVSELRFSVCDTGIGIPETDLERIFGSFEQVFRKSRSNQQGTGLGLAISRNLVELMGGILSVRSEVEKGSEFFFTIKLPVYEKQFDEILENNNEVRIHSYLAGKNILLAEDNDLNAEIAVTMLEMQGVHVERVVNGQQAVDRFQETLPGTYDLILMDLQMPVKGGLEAAAEIRSLSRDDAQEIPVIAMTANTLQEDREKALAAGMNAFIPKPFDVEQLYKSIEKFLH